MSGNDNEDNVIYIKYTVSSVAFTITIIIVPAGDANKMILMMLPYADAVWKFSFIIYLRTLKYLEYFFLAFFIQKSYPIFEVKHSFIIFLQLAAYARIAWTIFSEFG